MLVGETDCVLLNEPLLDALLLPLLPDSMDNETESLPKGDCCSLGSPPLLDNDSELCEFLLRSCDRDLGGE